MSRTPFEKAGEFETPDGDKIYIGRFSDEGDRLYSSVKYDKKRDDVMSRYEINSNATGSITDVSAHGAWSDGVWRLEMSRALDTGHADDAAIPGQGVIQFAIAAFDNKDGAKHSTSATMTLDTRQVGSTH